MDGYDDDLRVAVVAAACTVGFTLLTAWRYTAHALDVDTPGVTVRMVPLVPYFAYLFTRRADLPPALDSSRNWSLLTVAVTVCLLAYVALV